LLNTSKFSSSDGFNVEKNIGDKDVEDFMLF
jgi:hypothetical protein